MKAVVVGNGCSVLESHAGEFIDSCDLIVRLNGFKTTGYETHVGSRTSVYGCWSGRINNHEVDWLDQFDCIWLMETRDQARSVSCIQHKLKALSDKIEYLEQHNEWSTGWNSVLKCISLYGHVYITGFDQFTQSGWYWDTSTSKEQARVASDGLVCTSENPETIDTANDDTTHPMLQERLQMLKFISTGSITRLDTHDKIYTERPLETQGIKQD